MVITFWCFLHKAQLLFLVKNNSHQSLQRESHLKALIFIKIHGDSSEQTSLFYLRGKVQETQEYQVGASSSKPALERNVY